MAPSMTPEAFWAHPRTRFDVEILQERLRSIAAELGAEDAAARLPRLAELANDLAGRLVALELDVGDPPSEAQLMLARPGGS